MGETSLEHLVIVAGQRGVGKSHFLNAAHPQLDFGVSGLAFLAEADVPHVHLMAGEQALQQNPLAVVHVDLMNRFASQASNWTSVDEMLAALRANPFLEWPMLEARLLQAKRVSVVTIYADASINFERWVERGLSGFAEEGADSRLVDMRAVAVLGHGRLHRAFYRSWAAAVKQMEGVEHFWVDVSTGHARAISDYEMSDLLAAS